jgi:hypothetical protein
MGDLYPTTYTGEIYDCNACAIVPDDESNLSAFWAFLSSELFAENVRGIDQSLKVTPKNLLKVHFDIDHWSGVLLNDFPTDFQNLTPTTPPNGSSTATPAAR